MLWIVHQGYPQNSSTGSDSVVVSSTVYQQVQSQRLLLLIENQPWKTHARGVQLLLHMFYSYRKNPLEKIDDDGEIKKADFEDVKEAQFWKQKYFYH